MYGAFSSAGIVDTPVVADCSSRSRATGRLRIARDIRAGSDTSGMLKLA